MWSSAIGVKTATWPSATFVESHSPPMPTSITIDVDRGVGEGREREHGERLEEGQRLLAGGDELGVDDEQVRADVVPVARERLVA